jgi:hypothetical protein
MNASDEHPIPTFLYTISKWEDDESYPEIGRGFNQL